jgi:hypothetical protein
MTVEIMYNQKKGTFYDGLILFMYGQKSVSKKCLYIIDESCLLNIVQRHRRLCRLGLSGRCYVRSNHACPETHRSGR